MAVWTARNFRQVFCKAWVKVILAMVLKYFNVSTMAFANWQYGSEMFFSTAGFSKISHSESYWKAKYVNWAVIFIPRMVLILLVIISVWGMFQSFFAYIMHVVKVSKLYVIESFWIWLHSLPLFSTHWFSKVCHS